MTSICKNASGWSVCKLHTFSPNVLLVVTYYCRIPVIWARAIFYSQYLICKFLFFADKEGKFISITNRWVYGKLSSWYTVSVNIAFPTNLFYLYLLLRQCCICWSCSVLHASDPPHVATVLSFLKTYYWDSAFETTLWTTRTQNWLVHSNNNWAELKIHTCMQYINVITTLEPVVRGGCQKHV